MGNRWGSQLFLILILLLPSLGHSHQPCLLAIEEAAPLEMLGAFSLPILEGSGLAPFGSQLVAVSDRQSDLTTFRPDDPEGSSFIDLSVPFRPVLANESQFEAVATDGAGRVYILAERTGVIFVVDPVARKILHTIHLRIPRGHPLHEAWRLNPNSRGEGMVLLKNGHVLILKEKRPRALVEFGPEGETPIAMNEDAAVAGRQHFRLPHGEESHYLPLRTWRFQKGTKAFAKDLSDMIVAADGGLYLISDESKTLLRVSLPLPKRGRINFKNVWTLPAEIEKPEGLAVVPSGIWILSDRKKPRDNLFHLEFPNEN